MLSLTRKGGEKIIIELEDGTIIIITVKEIRKSNVLLGIEAPMNIKIFREEIYDGPPRL